MDATKLRHGLCWGFIVGFPALLFAADAMPAMLYAKGEAWINGTTAPKSSAIFPGDLIQTRADSLVNINATGSRILVLADSVTKYQGNEVSLEHGTLTVVTSTEMETRAGDVKVRPVSKDWAEFAVTHVDGTVQIVAKKGDLAIDDGQQTSTLSQGQQTTRDDSPDQQKKKKKRGGAAVAATGSVLNSTAAIAAGTIGVGAVALWVYTRGDEPISPKR